MRNPTIHACYILKQSNIVNVYIIPSLFEKYKIAKKRMKHFRRLKTGGPQKEACP